MPERQSDPEWARARGLTWYCRYHKGYHPARFDCPRKNDKVDIDGLPITYDVAGAKKGPSEQKPSDSSPAYHPYDPNCPCVTCNAINIASRKVDQTSDEQPQLSMPAGGRLSSRAGEFPQRSDATPIWLVPFLLIIGLFSIGVALSAVIGTDIPAWALPGFGAIFSVEKWFHYDTRRNRALGTAYRLFLNLWILLLLGAIVWSGVNLFTYQLVASPLVGTILFVAEFVLFVWTYGVLSRNRWRQPSMKLTVLCLAAIVAIASFAGVEPLTSYKNEFISWAQTRTLQDN